LTCALSEQSRFTLVRSQAGPAHAVVFETKPIAFALRDVVPGTDLTSVAQPGICAAIVTAPIDGPFGQTVPFVVTDGYQVTGTIAPDRPTATGP
jgi:hypothetical protein